MNIIDKIENSEILGHLTFLIDKIEKDINESEININLIHKKYINKQLIINIRVNNNFSEFAKTINDSMPKLKDLSNNMLRLGKAMSKSMAIGSLFNISPFKETIKSSIEREEEEMKKCLMS
jgi:hypothetical protein